MTNGIVSVILPNHADSPHTDVVVFKAVAGCDGYNAGKLAKLIEERQPVSRDEVYELAREAGFGCHDCLVVMDCQGMRFDGDDEIGPLYRETFGDPRFNPRWECGLASHVVLVETTP